MSEKVYIGIPHKQIYEAVLLETHQTRVSVELLEDHPKMKKGGRLRVPEEMCYEKHPGDKDYEDFVRESNSTIRGRCSLEDPPKWIQHPDRYLTGTRLNKSGRERDSQRQRLYRAEHDYGYDGATFEDIIEVRAYVNGISKYPWFQRRFGSLGGINIRTCRSDARRSHASSDEIAMAEVDGEYRIWSILHEITHILVPPPHPAHGPLFARTLLEITRHILSTNLEESYQKFDIKYTETS